MFDLSQSTLGKYQIIERLGKGGMAEVYRGYHPRLDRVVAIKVLHPQLIESQDFLARFEREARAGASLQHPNIIQIYDFDVEKNIYYLVMAYADGGTIKDKIDHARSQGQYLSLSEVEKTIQQVGSALDYAHSAGMLHRDIKPSNILLDSAGNVYLSDFGLVRLLSGSKFTTTGVLLGTPAYMSPEQGQGKDLTASSDLYSLGVVLFELLTNQVPFEADTPLAVIHQHIYTPAPSLYEKRPELPPEIGQVVTKALAKNPEHRYSSALGMCEELSLAITRGTTTARVIKPPRNNELAETETAKITMSLPPKKIAQQPAIPPIHRAQAPIRGKDSASKPKRNEVEPQKQVKRFKVFPILLFVVLLLAIITGGYWLAGNLKNPICEPIDECHRLANEALQAGDFELAINYLDQMLGAVPEVERPSFAGLWCMRGDAAFKLDRLDEALSNYQQCSNWTMGDPGLEELRLYADNMMREITEHMPQP